MTDITMTEWKAQAATIESDVQRRWPWLYKPWSHGGLRIESPLASASLDLRPDDSFSMRPEMTISSSSCLTGGPADIAEAVRILSEVRDVMLYVHGMTRTTRVWKDGECPCSYCGGRGVSQGRDCRRCGGKGKR